MSGSCQQLTQVKEIILMWLPGRRLGAKEVRETPEFMGLDEFSVRRRRLYHTALCDLVNREVMAVIEGQGKKGVEDYLNSLSQPQRLKEPALREARG